jgi:hypothetical protein
VCQWNKGETVKSSSTLQPLLIPPAIWKDISMDFITSLPKSGNKSIIMVVVDCLSKYTHFCGLQHSFTASMVAQIFMDQVFKLSQAIFGKNCSRYKAHNCISAQLIIPRLMAKQKLSTSVWKHI